MKFSKDIALMALAIAVFIGTHAAVDALDRHDAEKAREKQVEAAAPVYVVDVSEPVDVIELPIEVEAVQEVQTVAYYDVPLDAELQLFIISECEERSIDPAIIVAMAERESSYKADAVGDGGASKGLLQVQTRWHSDRMDKLGVTDLFDPYQNVTVSIDYLAELIDRGNGLEWALAAYNAGPTGAYSGYGKDYAAAILKNSKDLTEGMITDVLHG